MQHTWKEKIESGGNTMRMLVKKGNQRMWVKNPKSIKFWKSRANDCEARAVARGGDPDVKILKTIND